MSMICFLKYNAVAKCMPSCTEYIDSTMTMNSKKQNLRHVAIRQTNIGKLHKLWKIELQLRSAAQCYYGNAEMMATEKFRTAILLRSFVELAETVCYRPFRKVIIT